MRHQKIVEKAFECVNKRNTEDLKREYATVAHKLPVQILQNGLTQALGFLLAKGRKEHTALLQDLSYILGFADFDTLHKSAIKANNLETMKLTRDSIQASATIKRFVQGILKVSATGDNEGEGV